MWYKFDIVKMLLKPLKIVRGMPDSEYVAPFPPTDLTLVLYPVALSSFILTPPGLHALPLSLLSLWVVGVYFSLRFSLSFPTMHKKELGLPPCGKIAPSKDQVIMMEKALLDTDCPTLNSLVSKICYLNPFSYDLGKFVSL